MAKLTRKIHNAETGEETIVELTATEIAELELEGLAAEQTKAQEVAKTAAAASAVAKLEAIGLTAEEIAALRG